MLTERRDDTGQQSTPASTPGVGGIRLRVLLPLTLVTIVLLSVFVTVFDRTQISNRDQEAKVAAEGVRSLFKLELKTDVAVMRTVIDSAMQNDRLRAALAARDRKTLLEIGGPLLESLKRQHRITHFYFHNPDGTNLLRVHQPQKYGDKINRLTLLQAQRTGLPSSGIERGPIGTFVLRVVVPWRSQNHLLGYLEAGKEFQEIAHAMQGSLSSDITIAVDKKLLNRAQVEKASRGAQYNISWDQFPNTIVLDRSARDIPEAVASYLRQPIQPGQSGDLSLVSAGRTSHLVMLPLQDMGDRVLGELIVARDITSATRDDNAFVFWVCATSLLAAGVLLAFFYFFLGGVERVNLRGFELATANARFQRATEEAERANAAKSEFLSRMSHELRTPLNAILGFSQILEGRDLSRRDSECVGHIVKGGRHLLDLINEVLDIARIESGGMGLALEPVGLDGVLAECFDLMRPLAHQFQVHLQNGASAGEGLYVLADRQRLKQVLINLLANAIKYNRSGGKVVVVCRPTSEERIHLEVTDTGLGLTPDELEKLFVPFERLSATQTDIEGTGLGLVLSRRLVEAMGGSITVASIPGEGSAFSVELPAADSGTMIPSQAAASDIQEPDATAQLFHRELVVLSIEDNVSNARLIEVILAERPGVRLLSAMQGSMGLDLARQQHPDLILLDMNLPDIAGGELLRRLLVGPETAEIPVVIVSADAIPHQIESLLAAGATAYLTKPLDMRQVLHLIDGRLSALKAGHSGEAEAVELRDQELRQH